MRYEAIIDRPVTTPRLFSSRLPLDEDIAEAMKSMVRADVSRVVPQLQALKKFGANWDDRGSAAANPAAIDRAIGVLDTHALQVREAGLPWRDPHVSLNEDGDVAFEWWNGTKKLTLYVSSQQIDFVSSWGPDVDQQMHAGTLNGELLKLWRWFVEPADQ